MQKLPPLLLLQSTEYVFVSFISSGRKSKKDLQEVVTNSVYRVRMLWKINYFKGGWKNKGNIWQTLRRNFIEILSANRWKAGSNIAQIVIHRHPYTPYCSPYISYDADMENLLTHKELLLLVSDHFPLFSWP